MGILGDGENVLPPDAHLRKPQKEGAKRDLLTPGECWSLGDEEGSADHRDLEGRWRGQGWILLQATIEESKHSYAWKTLGSKKKKKKPELNRPGSEGMPLCLLRAIGLQLLACGCSLEPHLLWKPQPCHQRWQQLPEQQNNWKSEGDICKLGAWVGWDPQAERDFIQIPCWPLMPCMHGRPTEEGRKRTGNDRLYLQESCVPGQACATTYAFLILKKEVSALKKASAAEKAETSIQRVGEPQI